MFFWEACPGATFVQNGKALIKYTESGSLLLPCKTRSGPGISSIGRERGYLVNPVNPVQENHSATNVAV